MRKAQRIMYNFLIFPKHIKIQCVDYITFSLREMIIFLTDMQKGR